jgi:hypothetical protein
MKGHVLGSTQFKLFLLAFGIAFFLVVCVQCAVQSFAQVLPCITRQLVLASPLQFEALKFIKCLENVQSHNYFQGQHLAISQDLDTLDTLK